MPILHFLIHHVYLIYLVTNVQRGLGLSTIHLGDFQSNMTPLLLVKCDFLALMSDGNMCME